MNDPEHKRRGTEKRQRTRRHTIRFTEAEDAQIRKLADASGLSPGALLRNALFGVPVPRHRQPNIDDNALRLYLVATAKVSDALEADRAELGKSGSNLNQVAYMLNANTSPDRILNIIESTLHEHKAVLARHSQSLDDLGELRTMAMDVWGLER